MGANQSSDGTTEVANDDGGNKGGGDTKEVVSGDGAKEMVVRINLCESFDDGDDAVNGHRVELIQNPGPARKRSGPTKTPDRPGSQRSNHPARPSKRRNSSSRQKAVEPANLTGNLEEEDRKPRAKQGRANPKKKDGSKRKASGSSSSSSGSDSKKTPIAAITLIGDQRPWLTDDEKAKMVSDAVDFLERILPSELEKCLKFDGPNKTLQEGRRKPKLSNQEDLAHVPKEEGYKAMQDVRVAVLAWFKDKNNEPWKLLAGDAEANLVRQKFVREIILPLLPESARHKEEIAVQAQARWIGTLNMAASGVHDACSKTRNSVEERLLNIMVVIAGIFANEYDLTNAVHYNIPWRSTKPITQTSKRGLSFFSDDEWKEMAPLLVPMMAMMRMLLAKNRAYTGPNEGRSFTGNTFTFSDVYWRATFHGYVDNWFKNLKYSGVKFELMPNKRGNYNLHQHITGFEYYALIQLLPTVNTRNVLMEAEKTTENKLWVGPNHYDHVPGNRENWKDQSYGKEYEEWEKACFETQLWKQWNVMIGDGEKDSPKAANAQYVRFEYPEGPGWFDYNAGLETPTRD